MAGQLPQLLELGSTTCVPCQMMEKEIESLRHGYQGRLQIDFIDVTINLDTGRHYRIKLIPTQIFSLWKVMKYFVTKAFSPNRRSSTHGNSSVFRCNREKIL